MRNLLVILAASLIAVPALGQANVDFEAPTYSLGSMNGQSGGGISWTEFEAQSDASVAVPGFNSRQAGRWDVKDLGTDSDGDDMLGAFGAQTVFSVSGMSYVHMEPNRPGGTSRAGHFFVSDSNFFGSAITWLGNGNIGWWTAGFNINDTGAAIIYDQWVPFEVRMDYSNDTATIFYNNNQVAQGPMTSANGSSADQLDIWLDTIPLANNPNPGDWAMFDDIVITPEPASLILLLAGGLALIRRR